ncbi:hypothetical protein ABZ612_35305 [Streptomyces avermitilis]|uniref:hypothetical protein n=1 Tax=Streptomyces avermitilis TaxID=33903 RepID=UPI00340672BC
MSTIRRQAREITGGVHPHKGTHAAAAVDSAGRPLGAEQFEATAADYRRFSGRQRSFDNPVLGGGAHGAGTARHLDSAEATVTTSRPVVLTVARLLATHREGHPARPLPLR